MGSLLFQMIVVLAGGLASAVVPPTDVYILCQNGTNIAYWQHHGSKAASFSLTVKSYNSGQILLQNSSTQHHFNMSSDTPPTKDAYYFYLKALEGSDTSEVVHKTFSYSDELPSEVECFMDFPSLHLRVEAERIEFSFFNPVLTEVEDTYYVGDEYDVSEPPPSYIHDDTMQFYYNINSSHDKKTHRFKCPPEDNVCHGDILLNVDSIENCTTLVLEGIANGIRYKSSNDLCNLAPEKGPLPIYLYVGIFVIVLVTLVGLLLGTRKVAKTMIQNSLSDPTVQQFLRPPTGSASQRILRPEPNAASTLTGTTPLLLSTSDSPVDSLMSSPTSTPTATPPDAHQEQTHFPIGGFAPAGSDQPGDGYEARLTQDHGPDLTLEPEPEPEGYEGRGEGAGDEGYMQREKITSDALDGSRSSVAVEIAPEDHVDGYGPR